MAWWDGFKCNFDFKMCRGGQQIWNAVIGKPPPPPLKKKCYGPP